MPILPKEILRPAKYHTAEGVVRVTPKRLRRWLKLFHRMRDAKVQVPVPYEHQDEAKPITRAEQLARQVKWNAGFLVDMYLTKDGALWGDIEIADPKVARHIQNNVRYVSPEIQSRFKDGDGTVWRDVITHLALTPRPVFQRQKPFGTRPPRLSTIRLSLENMMATKKKKTVATETDTTATRKRKAAARKIDEAVQTQTVNARLSRRKRMSEEEEEILDDEEETPSEDNLEEDENAELSEESSGPETPEEYLSECLALLADKGINLPEHTSTDSFMRDLVVALHALNNSASQDDEQLSENEDDDDLTLGDGDDVPGEAQRERPLALSLQRRVKEQERQIADLMSERELTRLDRYEREGRCSPAKARELRGLIGRKRMSFASGGSDAQILKAQLDVIADTPKGTFTPGGSRREKGDRRLSHGSGGRPSRPAERQPRRTPWEEEGAVTPERGQEAAEEQLRNSGILPRTK